MKAGAARHLASLAGLAAVALISWRSGELYRRRGAPHPSVLAVGTAMACYALPRAAVGLGDRRRSLRRTKIVGGRICGPVNDHGRSAQVPTRGKRGKVRNH